MKKLGLLVATAMLMLAPAGVTAFANVVQNGGPGQPTGAYSNPGSVQGQTSMSPTGAYSKMTHDGYQEFW